MGLVSSFMTLLGRGRRKEKKVSVPELHQQFIHSGIAQRELLKLLEPEDVVAFTRHHQSVRDHILARQPDRRVVFRLGQLDNLIAAGLEKTVRRAHGESIIEKWN